jgi:methylenetetrahydrofolate--tRNA-(uracil-5-)-methyltransferase
LAVDREPFSAYITEKLSSHPNVEVVREEVTDIPDPIAVLATGPLTSDALSQALRRRLGDNFLYFYDAAAPVILGETINMEKCFYGGRFEQSPDYINCPMTEEEYRRFYEILTQARQHTPHEWEKLQFFEGCIPIEELARRGYLTPVFGPFRPVGIVDPRTGKEPFAVVQLRREDRGRPALEPRGLPNRAQVAGPKEGGAGHSRA